MNKITIVLSVLIMTLVTVTYLIGYTDGKSDAYSKIKDDKVYVENE